jgi:hypothetical protein
MRSEIVKLKKIVSDQKEQVDVYIESLLVILLIILCIDKSIER